MAYFSFSIVMKQDKYNMKELDEERTGISFDKITSIPARADENIRPQ